MINCVRCRGAGYLYDEYAQRQGWLAAPEQCRNCDGTGKVPWPNAWRPFEPARDTPVEIPRSCNLHSDCDEADEKVRASGGRTARCEGWAEGRPVKAGDRIMSAFHCSSEDCEDCFGC